MSTHGPGRRRLVAADPAPILQPIPDNTHNLKSLPLG